MTGVIVIREAKEIKIKFDTPKQRDDYMRDFEKVFPEKTIRIDNMIVTPR